MIVFDASVALKWYFDEPGAEAAKGDLIRHGGDIVVPGVFLVEVTAALVRRANMQKSLRSEVEATLKQFLLLIAEQVITVRETDAGAMAAAARLALDLGRPLKDCIYLALAMELGCDLITCDARLGAKARPVWPAIRVLEG